MCTGPVDSLPQLRKLFNDGPDTKHHNLLSRTILKSSLLPTITFRKNLTSHQTVMIIYNTYIFLHLPTDEWTLVFAGIPELLLWTIFLCIHLAVCLSEITASANELYLRVCILSFNIDNE